MCFSSFCWERRLTVPSVLLSRGQMMCWIHNVALVYIIHGLQSTGCMQSLFWSWSERSTHLRCMEWEIWAVVHSCWGYVGIYRTYLYRQICMHTYTQCFICVEEKTFSIRKVTEHAKGELTFVYYIRCAGNCSSEKLIVLLEAATESDLP